MHITDDRGATLAVRRPVARVVSLVPSSTETLVALGIVPVGVTRFCIHPEAVVRPLPKVGGTKDVDVARVLALAPDLVVANCEENTREAIDALDVYVRVYAAFPRTVDAAVADLRRLAALLGAEGLAAPHLARIAAARAALVSLRRPFTYAYMIWRDPLMTVSDDTFIASMLTEAGGTNAFAARAERFPVVDAQELGAASPDVVLLSSEPFPFRARHRDALAAATGLPRDRFAFVDGEACSWHGVRMAAGLEALAAWRARGWPTDPRTFLDPTSPRR